MEKEVKKEETVEKTEEIAENTPPKVAETVKVEPKAEGETIGQLKKDKKNPVPVFIMMGILILVAVFMPNIVDLVKNFDLSNIKLPVADKEEKPKEETPPVVDEPKEEIYYDLLETTSVTLNKLTLNNFKINYDGGNYLEFTAVNTDTNSYNLNANKLYIELYDSNKTFVERAKIISEENLTTNQTVNIKLGIKNPSASTFQLVERTTTDYPAMDVLKNDENKYLLTCINGNSKFVYEFNNNLLISIKETFSYTNEDLETYASFLTSYKEKASRYNKLTSMTASIAEQGVSFSFDASSSMNDASVRSLNNPYYFAVNTEAKVINYEMEAMNYNCE